MSLITDMMIFTNMGERAAMGRLNAWCAEHDTERHQQFAPLSTEGVGGYKEFTCELWALCGNYFPGLELAEVFPAFGWRYPRDAVLLINHEGDTETNVYRADRAGFGLGQCPEKTDHPLVARLRCELDIHDPQLGHTALVNETAYRWTHNEFSCVHYRCSAAGR